MERILPRVQLYVIELGQGAGAVALEGHWALMTTGARALPAED